MNLGPELQVAACFGNPDNPSSLWQGLAGGVAFLADLLAVTHVQEQHHYEAGKPAYTLPPSAVPQLLGFPQWEL